MIADALCAPTFADAVPAGCTFVHLTGTPHPAPWKAEQFRSVDLVSLRASVEAAVYARCGQFIYVSVAHPAPLMHAYIDVRVECERLIEQADLCSTILRPWYVLGPGHRWPYVLLPFYAAAERIRRTRDAACRLGLVRLSEMAVALARAVDTPPPCGVRVWDVPAIRQAGKVTAGPAAVRPAA